MDIIQIIPPKHLNYSLPNDLHRVLTVTNLTLHSVYVGIVKSHQYEISLSNDWFMLQAFQQKKINVTINWNQEGKNTSIGKLRLFYIEIQEEKSQEQIRKEMLREKNKYYFEDLAIFINFDIKALQFLNYTVVEKEGNITYEPISYQVNKKYYLMSRIALVPTSQNIDIKITKNKQLKNDILSYLQSLPLVVSIQQCEGERSFLIQFSEQKQDTCDFVSFEIANESLLFVMKRIVAYGKPNQIQTLVNIDSEIQASKKEQSNILKNKQTIKNQTQIHQISHIQQHVQQIQRPKKINEENDFQLKKKKELTKQSFMSKNQKERGKYKRRNKSQQKIIQNEFQQSEDQDQLFKQQILQLKQQQYQIKQQKKSVSKPPETNKKIQKINQTNIQMNQKILNIYIDTKQHTTEVYVLLRDCVRCYILEEPLAKKIIKFDPIYQENVNLPTPLDIYKQQLIFGNETCLFWVNLNTGQSQWKYVQRKYIYAISVIQELSLVSVGGKNFSKLSYFGKETSRSNIKLYSCSSSDKHQHLFTYDIPGNNVGNVMNTAYINAPPHGTKLLLIHTLNQEGVSTFHFLRVKAFNKIQVYCQIDLDQLGILKLLKFKYNKQSNLIICMEALGQTQMDSFKMLRLKSQYQKVEVFTQSCKFPLKRYISYHLGGQKDSNNKEWISLVEQGGCLVHIYDFEKNQMESLDLGKGQIKQIFSVYGGRFILICAESYIRIREKNQVQNMT